jgi:hypothetical protein
MVQIAITSQAIQAFLLGDRYVRSTSQRFIITFSSRSGAECPITFSRHTGTLAELSNERNT